METGPYLRRSVIQRFGGSKGLGILGNGDLGICMLKELEIEGFSAVGI